MIYGRTFALKILARTTIISVPDNPVLLKQKLYSLFSKINVSTLFVSPREPLIETVTMTNGEQKALVNMNDS